MHIYQILLPLFVNHQQRGQSKNKIFLPLFVIYKEINKGLNQSNQQKVYAIYIHEEKDAKLASLHVYVI